MTQSTASDPLRVELGQMAPIEEAPPLNGEKLGPCWCWPHSSGRGPFVGERNEAGQWQDRDGEPQAPRSFALVPPSLRSS
jgi:hypothetical protein